MLAQWSGSMWFDHQVVQRAAVQGVEHVLQELAGDGGVRCVQHGGLFIHNHIGVVGYAVGYGEQILEQGPGRRSPAAPPRSPASVSLRVQYICHSPSNRAWNRALNSICIRFFPTYYHNRWKIPRQAVPGEISGIFLHKTSGPPLRRPARLSCISSAPPAPSGRRAGAPAPARSGWRP